MYKYDYSKLTDNIKDLITEQQLKLGYDREMVRLYYPLSSLNRFLGVQCTVEEMTEALNEFSTATSDTLGGVSISNSGDRFCIAIPPEGSEYIHNNTGGTEFLSKLIATVGRHGCTMEEIKAVFNEFSDNVKFEEVNNGEFDYLIYFENSQPDSYMYCFTDEGCHIIYHRYTREDYVDFGF